MAATVASSSLCTISPSLAPQPSTSPLPQPFALALINGDVCLVQVPHTLLQGGMAAALMAADVRVFRHEFITQFRYSHCATVHPADVHILESIPDHCVLYEEDKGSVFLARDVLARMQRSAVDARRQAYAPLPRAHSFTLHRDQCQAYTASRPRHAHPHTTRPRS